MSLAKPSSESVPSPQAESLREAKRQEADRLAAKAEAAAHRCRNYEAAGDAAAAEAAANDTQELQQQAALAAQAVHRAAADAALQQQVRAGKLSVQCLL